MLETRNVGDTMKLSLHLLSAASQSQGTFMEFLLENIEFGMN